MGCVHKTAILTGEREQINQMLSTRQAHTLQPRSATGTAGKVRTVFGNCNSNQQLRRKNAHL